ncbi:hypothetical protein YC2023_020796 [Brassica napus]
MGRRKVEIKLIENKNSRQVTFSKRRTGLIEKARQLSVLCESSVAVLVVSASGKLYNSSSGDNGSGSGSGSGLMGLLSRNMTNIIDRYGIQHACELRSLDLAEKTRSYLPHNELLESVKSNLEESNVDNASVDSLISLEDQLETALSATRARKTELTMEFVKMLQEKVSATIPIDNTHIQRRGGTVGLARRTSQIGKTNGGRQNNSPANSSGINPPETLPLLK